MIDLLEWAKEIKALLADNKALLADNKRLKSDLEHAQQLFFKRLDGYSQQSYERGYRQALIDKGLITSEIK